MTESKKSSKASGSDAASQQFEAEYASGSSLVTTDPLSVKDFRRLLADRTVKNWSQWGMVAGFIPVPFLDLAAVSGLQIKMVYDLCKIYDVPFKQRQTRAILSGLVGGGVATVSSAALSGALIKHVPVIGTTRGAITQPAMSYATTLAIGAVFVRHFESNGTLMTMSVDALKANYQEQMLKAKSMFSKKGVAVAPAAPSAP
jgi:uncharacterized protein (DUF697 family)